MNIENHVIMKMYQMLLAIRDSAEYALLNVSYQPHIFYLRKSLLEESLREGPFVDMLRANKEAGQNIYNNLYNMYRDIFVDCKYLKVEDDNISRFDQDNVELLEQLIGNYYVVYDILDYNINVFENLNKEIIELSKSSHEYFIILYSYILLVNLLQQKNVSLVTNNDKQYISLVSLYYFFKDRVKTEDEELKLILEKVESVISMFAVDNKDTDIVDFITNLYESMDSLISEKEKNWQKDYQASISLLKMDTSGEN